MRTKINRVFLNIVVFAVVRLSSLSLLAAPPALAASLRPFYIIGHNADTIPEVREYLALGANAFDADVNVSKADTNELCIGHGPDLGTGPSSAKAPALFDYLKELRVIALENTNLALIYFDCKALVATPEKGRELLQAIRTYLIGTGPDKIDLNVIITSGTVKDRAIFDIVAHELGAHEAAMFDYEDHPAAASEYFSEVGITNQCYSNGTGVCNFAQWLFARHVWPSIKQACALRDNEGKIRLVITWTVNSPRLMKRYIKLGVDGMISEKSGHFYNPGRGIKSLVTLVGEHGEELGIRKATRADNPFYTRHHNQPAR